MGPARRTMMESCESLISQSMWDPFVFRSAVHWKCSCPLNPHSWFRLVWDLLGLSLVVYDTITIPLLVLVLPKQNILNSLSFVTNAFWVLDLLLAFNVGTYING